METLDARAATLEALRAWAATSRADLVAAAWRAGNRNVAELARVAGKDRGTIYLDLRSKGIDPTAREEPAMPTATTTPTNELPVPGWRHPHLLSIQARDTGIGTQYRYETKPFTGSEPMPELPEGWSTIHPSDGDGPRNWERAQQRRTEIRLVRMEWAKARFRRDVGRAVKDRSGTPYVTPAEAWQAYIEARDALTAAYAALGSTPDNMWRAALSAIVDAKRAAKRAAQQWDYNHAPELMRLHKWLVSELGWESMPQDALAKAAAEHGVDASGWILADEDDYTMTAEAQVDDLIRDGDERIREIESLTKA